MERKILELIASDRIYIPLSSMDSKLKRTRSGLASGIAEEVKNCRFTGERVYAYVREEDKEKARGMKEAIAEFSEEFPKYGTILAGKIAEKRIKREEHLYFGINEGCKLTSEDYMDVMRSIGITESTAKSLYPELMEVSRKLQKKRDEARSVIVGKYEE